MNTVKLLSVASVMAFSSTAVSADGNPTSENRPPEVAGKSAASQGVPGRFGGNLGINNADDRLPDFRDPDDDGDNVPTAPGKSADSKGVGRGISMFTGGPD